jgi:hypothetical protein
MLAPDEGTFVLVVVIGPSRLAKTTGVRMSISFLTALLLGCQPGITDITATVHPEVATLVDVSWTTPEGMSARVEYGKTADLGLSTEPSSSGQVRLFGLHGAETYHFRVVPEDGKQASETLTFLTDNLPGDLPTLTLSGDPEAVPGYIATTLLGNVNAAVVIDGEGEIIWYKMLPTIDYVTRMRLRPDKNGITYIAKLEDSTAADLQSVDWEGTPLRTVEELAAFNHDWVELPDESLLFIAYDHLTHEGNEYRGDKVMRLNTDDSREEVWSVWNDFDIEDFGMSSAMDTWSHANALHATPDGNGFFIGLRNMNTIAKVGLESGDLEWWAGFHEDATYQTASLADGFNGQHNFHALSSGNILVFDNHILGGTDTRAAEYSLHDDTGEAVLEWEFHHDPRIDAGAMGDVRRMDTGDTLITWCLSGEIQVISPEREVLWQLNTELGIAFGYTEVWDEDTW